MNAFTVEDKIAIIMWYNKAESVDEIIRRFGFAFPDRPGPTGQTIMVIFIILNGKSIKSELFKKIRKITSRRCYEAIFIMSENEKDLQHNFRAWHKELYAKGYEVIPYHRRKVCVIMFCFSQYYFKFSKC